MKVYKILDIALQIITMLYMFLGIIFELPGFFWGIFVLGALQIISALTHLFWRKETWFSKLRKVYYWLLLLPVAVFILALIEDHYSDAEMAGLIEFVVLAGISMLMALFYLTICIIETRRLKN